MKQHSSPFEPVPSGIGVHILCSVPDLRTLLALIAASPQALRLYRSVNDQIFVSVARNEIGEHLIQQAIFLRRDGDHPYALVDLTNTNLTMNTVSAKALLKAERLTCAIIQACVNDELKGKVTLSKTEWTRLRQGLYNLRTAAKLSAGKYVEDYVDATPFYQRCTPPEILEMLYVLCCLRNRYNKHLRSLDEQVLDEMINRGFLVDFTEKYSFSKYDTEGRATWNRNGPWREWIEVLHEECQLPAKWDRQWMPDPSYQTHDESIEVLESFIRNDYSFDGIEGDGYRWLRGHPRIGIDYEYHNVIPLGFMIWNDNRLREMDWVRRPPPMMITEASHLQTHRCEF